MSRRRTQAGVTLMELLIAVTLLSLVTVGMLFAKAIPSNAAPTIAAATMRSHL